MISEDSVPFHGEQYICLSLTTRTWHDDSIPLSTDHWREGGAPRGTSIMPWSVSAIRHECLDTTGEFVDRVLDRPDNSASQPGCQGHLRANIVNAAARRLIDYLDNLLE